MVVGVYFVYITKERDVRNKKAEASFILIGNILRLTSAIAMMYLRSLGFDRSDKKGENPRNQELCNLF